MFLSQSSHLFSDCTSLLQDRKFDTALRKSTIEAFLDRRNEEHHWTDDLIWTHYAKDVKFKTDTTLLPKLIQWLFQKYNPDFRSRPYEWQKMWNMVLKNIEIQDTWINSTIDHTGLPYSDAKDALSRKIIDDTPVPNLIVAVDEMTQIVNLLPKINEHKPGLNTPAKLIEEKSKYNQFKSRKIPLKLTWSNKLCVIEWDRETWLLPKPYILEIHNKLADIISVLVYSQMVSGTNHSEKFYTRVEDFIKELCYLHIRFPAGFFDFANSLEGLCIGRLIKSTEDWVNDDLWENLLEELSNTLLMDVKTLGIIRMMEEAPDDEVIELSCLTKVTGHPLTDIQGGAEKLYSRVNDPFEVSTHAVAYTICAFKRNFVRNFILKHKRWPSCNLDYITSHPSFLHCMPRGLDPCSSDMEKKFGKVQWENWASVELNKELKFNFCNNVIPLLKDKALSVCRSKVLNTYLNNQWDPKTCSKDDKIKFEETRVLLHYLFTDDEETDHIDYLGKYCSCEEDLTEILDYLVIRLVPKEKELKTKARMFGCKTYLERARSAIQEQNMATFLNLYNDEQGMTLSELAIMKKIYAMQNINKLYRTHRIYKVTVDAEAWNTKHREESQRPFHQNTTDKVFGYPIFSRTHTTYRHTLSYVPDEKKGKIPFWIGQLGGTEGQEQKTWTEPYGFQMGYTFIEIPYEHFQIVHGDDYRVVIAVPLSSIPPGGEADVIENIRQRMAVAAAKFGHKIKVKESYASEHILIYTKIVYYKEIQLPSALRKIQKTYGSTNAFLPILDDYIGSSFSNAHSTCYTDTVHYPSYIVGLFWSFYYLLRDSNYKHMGEDALVGLSLTPSCVGGLPIIYLHNFLVRGESDLLCAFVNLIQHTERFYPEIGRHLRYFLEIPFTVEKPYSLLLKDPYSLPIKRPPSISLYLKKIVRKRLETSVKNRKVRDLLLEYTDESLRMLVSDLATANEWQAKPITALYSNTPYHLVDELLSSFVSAKSIMDLLITSSRNIRQSQRIITRAMKRDKRLHRWRAKILKGEYSRVERPLLYEECPAEFCQRLRREAWELNITTITHPPPQHQVVFSTQDKMANNLWALNNHFVMTIHDPNFLIGDSWHYADGGKTPFLGHTTTAGTITPTIRVSEKDPIASKVSNLLTLRSWMNKSMPTPNGPVLSNFPEYIDKVLRSYTDTPPSELQKFAPAWKSGSITHRLRAHGFRESIVPNNLHNHYTLVTGETNTHRHFRDTREDFTINYLHLFCYGTAVILKELEVGHYYTGPRQVWMITTDCAHCNAPIVEPPMVIEKNDFLATQVPKLLMTELGEASEELIKMAQQEYDLQYPALGPMTEEIPIEAARMIVIYECLKKSWIERLSLSRRYGVHDMTSMGLGMLTNLTSLTTDKSLGETEIRALPLRSVVDTLSTYIFSYLLTEMPGIYTDNVSARLNTILPSTLPWFTLLEWYYKSGLLRPLIRLVSDITGLPNHEGCFYNVNTATIYVGKALWSYALTNPVQFPYLCCTVYDTHETIYRRYISLYNREMFTQMKLLHGGCKEHYEEIQRLKRPLNYDEQVHIIEAYIIFSRDPIRPATLEEQDEGIMGYQAINIHGLDDYTNEEWDKWDEDPRPGMIKHLDWLHAGLLISAMRHMNDEQVDQLIEEEQPLNATYWLVRYPMGACIDKVRSEPDYNDKRVPDDGGHRNVYTEDLECPDPLEEDGLIKIIPSINNAPTMGHMSRPLPRMVERSFVNPNWPNYSRILGSSISSCNKIHYILRLLNLTSLVEQRGWICCVGEGEGGILHHLLSWYPMSLGVFNTYIDDMRSGASAGVCDRDTETRYRYSKVPLLQGIGDLTEVSTIETYMTEYPQRYWLFTCDADMRKSTEAEMFKLWRNVVWWWLRSRTQNGVLIMKVFGTCPYGISRACTILSLYSLYVHLVRVPLSHINTELYVVAYGTGHLYTEQDIFSIESHPMVFDTIYQHCNELILLYNYRITNVDQTLIREAIECHDILISDYNPDDHLLLYIITQKMRLRSYNEYRDLMLSHKGIIGKVKESIRMEIKDLMDRMGLRYRQRSEIKHSFKETQTLKHQQMNIERYLYLVVYDMLLDVDVCDKMFRREPFNFDINHLKNQLINTCLEWVGYYPLYRTETPHVLGLGTVYRIDILNILQHASGSAIQLIGVLNARRFYQQNQGMFTRDDYGVARMYDEEEELERRDDEIERNLELYRMR